MIKFEALGYDEQEMLPTHIIRAKTESEALERYSRAYAARGDVWVMALPVGARAYTTKSEIEALWKGSKRK